MLITDQIEVAQPLDAVWAFFGDIPQVAACLPGANLTEQVGDDKYAGDVTIQTGPVKLEFDGQAEIRERNESTRTIVVDAAGADRKGRGQAALALTAGLVPLGGSGTRVDVSLDLSISGAAAQYGRGLIADVTAVLLQDFSTNMQSRLQAIAQGLDPNAVAVKPASGLSIALRAARLALVRVVRRFFMPYQPQPTGR
jgi:carbon monoxide dehydrogenase subunit G